MSNTSRSSITKKLFCVGAQVALTPAGGLDLDSEDIANGTVCAELVDPQMVERDVMLRFIFVEGTASMYHFCFCFSGSFKELSYSLVTQPSA